MSRVQELYQAAISSGDLPTECPLFCGQPDIDRLSLPVAEYNRAFLDRLWDHCEAQAVDPMHAYEAACKRLYRSSTGRLHYSPYPLLMHEWFSRNRHPGALVWNGEYGKDFEVLGWADGPGGPIQDWR